MRALQQKPNHKFDGVASIIAKGDPPKWLVVGLEHFSDGIGVDHTSDLDRRFEMVIERMHGATDALIKWLPIWENLPYGMKCPKDVAVVLDALPRIKKELIRAGRKHIGRRPDAQCLICAAVVARAWKIIHGKPEPRSDQLLRACSEYWRACGGRQKGEWDEPENWRRPVERALKADYSWIERVLLAVQNSH